MTGEVPQKAGECAEVQQASIGQPEVRQALEQAGAILSGHFKLTSGRHSDTYVQCARILEDPALTSRLARGIAANVCAEGIDLVATPAVGGIIIGFAVAQALGVHFIFSEREGGAMTFRRGFAVPADARVLIVEDVVTTGGSVAEVVDLVRSAGADPVAVASIIDRGGPKRFDVPLYPLLELEVESWPPDECALCTAGTPLYAPGSRAIGK